MAGKAGFKGELTVGTGEGAKVVGKAQNVKLSRKAKELDVMYPPVVSLMIPS